MLWPHVVEAVPCSPFLTSDSCLLLESLLLHPLPPCLFFLFLPSCSSSESLLLRSLLFSFILILSILLQLFESYPLSVISHIDITCISCFWCFVLIVSMLFSLFSLSLLLFQSGISSKSLKYPQRSNCLLDLKTLPLSMGLGYVSPTMQASVLFWSSALCGHPCDSCGLQIFHGRFSWPY